MSTEGLKLRQILKRPKLQNLAVIYANFGVIYAIVVAFTFWRQFELQIVMMLDMEI